MQQLGAEDIHLARRREHLDRAGVDCNFDQLLLGEHLEDDAELAEVDTAPQNDVVDVYKRQGPNHSPGRR